MINTNVYNYLVQTYIPKSNSPYDIHKKSELRNIYSTIVKKNIQSPLYKVTLSEDKQQFALNIKDSALYLQSSLKAVHENNPDSVFLSQKAYSDQPDKASADIVTEDLSLLPDSFSIKINRLASTQKNESSSVYKESRGPRSGSYVFQARVGEESYEFQFNINPATTKNKDILSKLSNFINKSDIGIRSGLIEEDGGDKIHLALESSDTGNKGLPIFELEDVSYPVGSSGIISHYSLDSITDFPSNANFEINGVPSESASNYFVLNHSLRMTLHEPSSDPFQIVYQADSDKILNSIRQITDTYNSLIGLANSNLADQRFAGKLASELTSISSFYKNDLEAAGINFSKNGAMNIDDSLASQSARDGDLQKLFCGSNGFAGRLSAKMAMISIDPMEYIDKKLVTYPNTSRPGTTNPYVVSIYSGMLFNYYC